MSIWLLISRVCLVPQCDDRKSYIAVLETYKTSFPRLPLPCSRLVISRDEIEQSKKDFSREISVMVNGRLMPLGTPARFAEFVRHLAVTVAAVLLDVELTQSMKDAVDAAWGLQTSPHSRPAIPKHDALSSSDRGSKTPVSMLLPRSHLNAKGSMTPNSGPGASLLSSGVAAAGGRSSSVTGSGRRASRNVRRGPAAVKRYARIDALSDSEATTVRVSQSKLAWQQQAEVSSQPGTPKREVGVDEPEFHSDIETDVTGSAPNTPKGIAIVSAGIDVHHRAKVVAASSGIVTLSSKRLPAPAPIVTSGSLVPRKELLSTRSLDSAVMSPLGAAISHILTQTLCGSECFRVNSTSFRHCV